MAQAGDAGGGSRSDLAADLTSPGAAYPSPAAIAGRISREGWAVSWWIVGGVVRALQMWLAMGTIAGTSPSGA